LSVIDDNMTPFLIRMHSNKTREFAKAHETTDV